MRALVLAAVLAITPHQGLVPSRERIEADLAVTIGWPDGAPRHRWWRVAPRIVLTNRSETTTHRVVKSGDGSDAGWREPYFHATVERQDESGAWVAMPPQMSARCATYHPDWLPDVVDLAPGASILLDWLEFQPYMFQDDRPHRITVHYEYRRQPVRAVEGGPPPPEGLGRMGDRPEFHLVSESSELRFDEDRTTAREIAESLRVRLDGIVSPARWSDLRASAVIENHSSDGTHRYVATDEIEATMPWDGGWGTSEPVLALDVQRLRDDGAWIPVRLESRPRAKPFEADWRRRVRSIEHGRRMELSPSRALAAPSIALDQPLRIRLRARYAYRALPRIPEPGAKLRYPGALGDMSDMTPFTLTSEWIEVDLRP